jgi:hypothetical protein
MAGLDQVQVRVRERKVLLDRGRRKCRREPVALRQARFAPLAHWRYASGASVDRTVAKEKTVGAMKR